MGEWKGGIVSARGINVVIVFLLGLLVLCGPVLAQGDPTSNVNLIGMTPDSQDIPDTYNRQQNEPSCAIRPDDSACIICAYNDYRGVDSPVGDSWQGVSQSCDAGDSWLSRLAPGHPGDLDANLIPAEFAADPRFSAIPGMAILNFIAAFRDNNDGVLAIQHWLEVEKEDADYYEPSKVTWFADTGTSGRFIDKPDMLSVMDPPNQQGTPLTLVTEMENSELGEEGFITRDFPTGTLYVAYAVLTGSQSFKVLVKTSADWGRTWKNQVLKLSEDQNQVSGISLTAIDGKVLAVWRRLGDNNDVDSIMYSVISNGGKKATKAEVLADICAFDQPTLTGSESFNEDVGPFGPIITFRTNDFPWAANDGVNFMAFYSDRGRNPDGSCDVSGRPRIVMHHSDNSGLDWADNGPIPIETPAAVPPDSFMFMPAAFGANGEVQVVWYDTRREDIGGALTPYSFVADYSFGETVYVQRTVDVYTTKVTMLSSGEPDLPFPSPVRVSQYSVVVDEGTGNLYENEASLANKKLFAQGFASFLGDYLAVAAREFRKTPDGLAWKSNASPNPDGFEDFFVAWADNRDVRGEIPTITDPLTTVSIEGEEQPLNGEAQVEMLADNQPDFRTGPPRDTTKTTEGLDGGDGVPPVCGPGTERSRDSNVYGSLIKDQLRVYAPTARKPFFGVKRAFPLSVTNSTNSEQTYRLTVVNSPDASFRQNAMQSIEYPVTVLANSSLARTVFVDPTSSDSVTVRAELFVAPFDPDVDDPDISQTEVVATIELNNSAEFLDPENCSNNSCAVASNELHDLKLQTLDPANAALLNAALLNAALLNPSISAQELLNANLLNANLLNADLLNANLLNPTLVALALEGVAADPNYCANNPASSLCEGDPELVDAADVIMYAAENPNTVNAALLNAALLNAALLNANLLNANLLNANLLNANLLNANLLNADLLNANLLNADLLNANLLNANLLNADLLNANLLNADLLNADLLNANLLNANLLNATLEDDPNAVVTYDDYTYPVTNEGNVTTSINADITANAPPAVDEFGNPVTADDEPVVDEFGNPVKDVLGTMLIAWTVNATPTTITNNINGECEDRVQLDTRVKSIVPNPDGLLEEATIGSPFEGEVSNIAAAGETVFFTLRVFGTPDQLKNVRVSGFTASSQASNCRNIGGNDPNAYECDPDLTIGGEKILFKDTIPPVLTVDGDNPTTIEAGIETYEELGATAIDNVDGDISSSVVITPMPGPVDSSAVADFWVEYTVSDSAGNPATPVTRTVYVVDTTPPDALIDLPASITLDATSSAGAVYSWGAVTAEDAVDGTITAVCESDTGLTSDDTFPLGPPGTTVNCTATDSAGLTSTGSFTVTVTDQSPPVLPPLPDLLLEAQSTSGTPVSWPDTAVDAVAGTVPLICVPASGSTFPIGLPGTTVYCTATDGFLPISDSFTVTVTDTEAPMFIPVDPFPNPVVLLATQTTLELTWPVTVLDFDPNIQISCSVGGNPADLVGDLELEDDRITAQFEGTFSAGGTLVECTASDSNPDNPPAMFNFTVTVVDDTPPEIEITWPPEIATEVSDPSQPLPIETETSPVTVAYSVVVTEFGSPDTEAVCVKDPDSGSEFDFGWGDTTLTCTAIDEAGNTAEKSVTVTVRYLYDVNLILPKGRARAGSTIPLDWQYLDWDSGLAIDSSAFMVGVTWEKTNDATSSSQSCPDLTPAPTDGSSFIEDADSGNSDFRYSESSDTWQFSWQTPDALGWHKLSVSPPGGDVDGAWACVRLR